MKKALIILALSLMCIGINAQGLNWNTCTSLMVYSTRSTEIGKQKVLAYDENTIIALAKDLNGCYYFEGWRNATFPLLSTKIMDISLMDTIYDFTIFGDSVYFCGWRNIGNHGYLGVFAIADLFNGTGNYDVFDYYDDKRITKLCVYKNRNNYIFVAGIGYRITDDAHLLYVHTDGLGNSGDRIHYFGPMQHVEMHDLALIGDYLIIVGGIKNDSDKIFVWKQWKEMYFEDDSLIGVIYDLSSIDCSRITSNDNKLRVVKTYKDRAAILMNAFHNNNNTLKPVLLTCFYDIDNPGVLIDNRIIHLSDSMMALRDVFCYSKIIMASENHYATNSNKSCVFEIEYLNPSPTNIIPGYEVNSYDFKINSVAELGNTHYVLSGYSPVDDKLFYVINRKHHTYFDKCMFVKDYKSEILDIVPIVGTLYFSIFGYTDPFEATYSNSSNSSLRQYCIE